MCEIATTIRGITPQSGREPTLPAGEPRNRVHFAQETMAGLHPERWIISVGYMAHATASLS